MNLKITAVTVELNNLKDETFRSTIGELLTHTDNSFVGDDELNDFIRCMLAEFSGKNAGICYMADDYYSQKVSGSLECINRFVTTIPRTHHSIADHCKVTVLFEDVPKIFAMIMNSFRDYATSEKSARYTVMENLPDDEARLYNKWRVHIKAILINKGVSEKQAEKIANENARYFISIFSPATTFSYTTSFRQWNYINRWFKELITMNSHQIDNKLDISNRFYQKLEPWLTEFTSLFENTFIYTTAIKDPKSRRIDFIPQLYPDTSSPIYEQEYYGDTYCSRYYVSFSSLAQLHRHRTIQYSINNLGPSLPPGFFIPDLFDFNQELIWEWLSDMHSVSDKFPQGQIIEVVELGSINNFLLKCDERLCGRAQYETMKNVSDILMRFYTNGNVSKYFKDKISSWVEPEDENHSLRVKSKCEMRDSGCADRGTCIHGPLHATDRIF